MTAEIPTIEGPQTPSTDDLEYMDYLNGLWDVGGFDFGLLLFKGDPAAFRIGRDEWLAERD